MRKFGTIGALVLAGLVVATGAEEGSSTTPPTNLKKVGDHWTPWDPPPAGPDDYIIQKGDTLWDLAETWLGDPFLWPQIWDENRYILDSHWIYPGDPLVIPGKPTVVPPEGPPEGPEEEAVPEEEEVPEEVVPEEERPKPEPAPLLPVADPVDIYCSGYIDPDHLPSGVWVVGHELEREILGQGDVIYLSQGRNHGMLPGTEWGVLRPTLSVVHPATGAEMGQYVRRLGRVRVIAVQAETSMAVIEMACEDIHGGDELVTWAEIPIPRMSSMPPFDRHDVEPSGGATGYVVAVRDHVTAVGTGNVIHVDLGADAGVRPGDILRLYRDHGGLPRLMLGQAVILTVEPGTSTARITASVRESAVGDRVEGLR